MSDQLGDIERKPPSDGWLNCQVCSPKRACSQHADEAAAYWGYFKAEQTEIARLEAQLAGAVRALEAIAALSDLHPGDWPTVGRRAVSKANQALGRPGGQS